MLAILPDMPEDEVTSDCSDSSNESKEKFGKCRNKTNLPTLNAAEAAAVSGPTATHRFSHPGDPANNVTSDALVMECPVAVYNSSGSATSSDSDENEPNPKSVPTNTRVKVLSEEQLQKFAELRAKRVQASEEEVAEGCRRHRRRRKRKHGQNRARLDDQTNDSTPGLSPSCTSEVKEDGPSTGSTEEGWKTLKGYLDVNSHMSQGVDHGQYAPKSGLEKRLDDAVAEGDFDRAEELSEELAARDFGCKVAKAADARDYMKWKNERDQEKAAKKRKKKKKLTWGAFQVKNRWEMKANM